MGIKGLPQDIREAYEVHEFRHAIAILATDFPKEFKEVCKALRQFSFTKADILKAGGNESEIPKKFSRILRPLGWQHSQLKSRLIVGEGKEEVTVSNDTHKVDYIKGRVAFDLEWNSKDQTFDRDLYALRAFFEFDKISLGIIVTRSLSLNPIFQELKIMQKYGASTTHMAKLLPRLHANRNGGCPVLVLGITPKVFVKE